MLDLAYKLRAMAEGFGVYTGLGSWRLVRQRLLPGQRRRPPRTWSWWVVDTFNNVRFGSCVPAREVIRAHRRGKVRVTQVGPDLNEMYVEE